MTRWQYHIVNLGTFNTADRMAASFGLLGSEGWELVTIHDKASNWFTGTEKGLAVFKRAVPDGADPEGPWARWQYAANVGVETTEPASASDGGFRAGPHATTLCATGEHTQCRHPECTCTCHIAVVT